MRRWLGNVGLATSAVVVAGAVAEVTLRTMMPPTTGYFVLVPGTDRTFHPLTELMPGVEGTARYRVNADGIRGRDFGADGSEFRILAVGGSTTECAYLDEGEVWTALLERTLDTTRDGRAVWVGNVGRSGRTVRDHVVQLKYLLRQYPPIDVVLVLAGANDVLAFLAHGDAYERLPPITDPDAEAEQLRRAFLFIPGAIHRPGTDFLVTRDAPWYRSAALWQLARRVRIAYVARSSVRRQDVRGTTLADWQAARARGRRVSTIPPGVSEAVSEYGANLDAMRAVAANAGVRLVFITQPSLWHPDNTQSELARLWTGGLGSAFPPTRFYSVGVLHEVMGRFNDRLREFCRDRALECVDAAAVLSRDTTILYDDVHFTEEGSRRLAALLARTLGEEPPF